MNPNGTPSTPQESLMRDYIRLLRSHDWTFEFSDDQQVWRRGSHERKELEFIQPQIDPDFTVWNKYAPKEFRK